MSSEEPEETRVDAEAPEREPGGPEPRASSGPPRWLLFGSAAFAIAAVVVAAVFGAMWWVAAADDNADVAAAREDVVRVAGQAVTAFTEVDHENLDEYFNRQKSLVTEDLKTQISSAEQTYRKAISDAKTKVVSTVQDVAVEELNEREGVASALATVSTKVTRGQEQGTKTLRLEVQLKRVDDNGEQVWKVSQIGDVPVAATTQ
ncbi:hypothetical protein DI005_05010 [Prauserella sp. PE36]|uniref:Mce-associated membrane protein n=1 Tax=Prauserella endophytica TaxID=1592324 RepID=A0ABY2S291_9PSEU|nr:MULTISPECIES: hypothetical protein [Prauserella]PXY17143.1 hypothetical protein BAY59_36880 [Prauserella coralliicola]RBM22802.1 hypothetical protein DI005_05010 [Prauserella sp. PE36]TKG67584.1 hypothetical protein FCN18_22790 [Prauserella endophytica]